MKMNTPFHMVTPSPWPILMAFSSWSLIMATLNKLLKKKSTIMLQMMSTSTVMALWWRDVDRESYLQGMHTKKVTKGIKMGMMMFITSEAFLFMSLFWVLFHSSTMPSIMTGMEWPPKNIKTFNPMDLPLMNTLILITSGMTLTWSHQSLKSNNKSEAMQSMLTTLMMGTMFMSVQMKEYSSSPFTMSDSIYGSTFFMMTGFHGMHVMIGMIMLTATMSRMYMNKMSKSHHILFEMSAWYWHFVDIVWIMLYLMLYI